MQAAQIKIGELYALKDGPEVVRFKVAQIVTVTVRDHNKNAKTNNTVIGVIEQGDLPDTTVEDRKREVAPDMIISHYTAFAELQAKQKEEARLAKEEEDRKIALRERLRAKLYEVTGLVRPAKPAENSWAPYQEPFSTSYGNRIQIDIESMQILLESLEKLQAEASLLAR
jgi:hypothetical protein